MTEALHPAEHIQSRILVLRGQRVLLDRDLAALYGVPTKRLNEQIKRNPARFPEDFVFTLTSVEKSEVVAKCDHLRALKFSPVLPAAFTEHGALMAANVLNSPQAVAMSVQIVRAFIHLRQLLINHKALSGKLAELETRVGTHDEQLAMLVAAIRQLTAPESRRPKRRMGFYQGGR